MSEVIEILKTYLPVVIAVCGTISATIPDSKLGGFAKIINGLALNFGNASNDPAQE